MLFVEDLGCAKHQGRHFQRTTAPNLYNCLNIHSTDEDIKISRVWGSFSEVNQVNK